MCIDKDILVKDNKIYSPESCVFVPQEINKLLTLRKNHRGDLPLGVFVDGEGKYRFKARCNYHGTSERLGSFATASEAHIRYVQRKEEIMKAMASEYKTYIPEKLYDALMAYQIDGDK